MQANTVLITTSVSIQQLASQGVMQSNHLLILDILIWVYPNQTLSEYKAFVSAIFLFFSPMAFKRL